MRIYIVDNGDSDPTWGDVNDLAFVDLPTEDADEADGLVESLLLGNRKLVPSTVDHMIVQTVEEQS